MSDKRREDAIDRLFEEDKKIPPIPKFIFNEHNKKEDILYIVFCIFMAVVVALYALLCLKYGK